jgi:hypothetical protein
MRFLLALFDQSTRNPKDRYWTWFHPELSVPFLSRVYDEVISHNLPDRPQDFAPGDIHGGLASLDGWLCCYRIVNGGLDSFGREGRFVPICAFARLSDIHGHNCVSVLESVRVRDLAQAAKDECPVPPPTRLEFDLDVPPAQEVKSERDKLMQTGHVSFSSQDALVVAGSVIAALDPNRSFQCAVVRNAAITSAKISSGAEEVTPVAVPPSHARPKPVESISAGTDRSLMVPAGGVSDPETSPTPNGYSSRKVYLKRLGMGIFCFILGLLSGLALYPLISKPPPFDSRINFRIQREGRPSKIPFANNTTFVLKVAPETLKILTWKIDGIDQTEGIDRLNEELPDGTHKVEVQFRYSDQQGRENTGKAVATVKVDSSDFGTPTVDVWTESAVQEK